MAGDVCVCENRMYEANKKLKTKTILFIIACVWLIIKFQNEFIAVCHAKRRSSSITDADL